MSAAPERLADRLAAAASAELWRDAVKTALAEQRAALLAAFEAGEAIDALIARRLHCIDDIVRSAWAQCLPDDAALSLFATGGYGRGELYPQSDIDLLVLAEPEAQATWAAAIGAVFAKLWDAGLSTSQAVRSLDQCTEAAGADVTVLTALLESRALAGPPASLAALAEAIGAQLIWPPAAYFEAKRDEQRARHARYFDTAHNLEPNLKEGPGGLRDLHTLSWMAMRLFAVPGLRALVPLGLLGEDENASLEREWRVLARLRFGLHLIAKRREERLGFDHQKTLASLMGYQDQGSDNLAVEQMMQGFFRAAQTVMRINDRLLQRFEEQLAGSQTPIPLRPGFELRQGYLAMQAPARLREGAAAVFDLFAVWAGQGRGCGLHSETARALGESLGAIAPYPEQPAEVRAAFVELLEQDHAVLTLARMARVGVLSRYLPAFGKVSGRMQYDLFHVYTVDQHTLTVLGHMQGFADGPDPRFSIAHDVLPRLRKRPLLLLAGLFHDIAKGRGGDHSVLGGEDVRDFAQAHGLPEADIDLLVWLVREHLLMSVTAQRQDISDPEVVARFAKRVADREHLDYLYLLTCADIAGTSPKLWNAWKDRLLADLYAATRFALRRGLEHPVHAAEIVAECREQALAQLLHRGVNEADVVGVWASFPEVAFLRYRPEQIAWQTRGIVESGDAHTLVQVRSTAQHRDGPVPRAQDAQARPQHRDVPVPRAQDAQARPQHGGLEVFVRTPDRDGVFAALVATLDRLGLSVLEARVLNSTDGYALDTFQTLAQHEPFPSTDAVIAALLEALRDPLAVRPVRRATPRQLRHFRVPARVDFDAVAGAPLTRMSLVCTDQPGLLAGVAEVLRQHRLRVHDARIATFGERVEDFFLLSDERDQALCDQSTLHELRAALVARVDGESSHGTP